VIQMGLSYEDSRCSKWFFKSQERPFPSVYRWLPHGFEVHPKGYANGE
jgi:hypothetical protein